MDRRERRMQKLKILERIEIIKNIRSLKQMGECGIQTMVNLGGLEMSLTSLSHVFSMLRTVMSLVFVDSFWLSE